ncbi:hypothetical protein MLD38_027126 [Melastoma candidum]|uniref:Uncharacterized protein n=1 Tax=Melastoma candidum TaxID=119954 RepID=A0ACB9P176_9MYRT|nr:hypothetical protein MLD38_027126 [Melastoma candidum]
MIQATRTTPSSSRVLFSFSSPDLNFLGRSHHAAIYRQEVGNRSIMGSPGAVARSTNPVSVRKRSNYEIENLTTWLLKQEQAGNIDTELTIVISSISQACKQIASLLQRSSIINLTGSQGTINIQGEQQKKLDVVSNEVFCNCLRSSGRTKIIASEEEDVPVAVEETYSGNYTVVFDPREGNYDLWDDKLKSYLTNLRHLWDDKLKSYLTNLRQPGPNGKPYTGRYIGCLVGEIHRMLLVGGVYGNPDNVNSKEGNLRLLYECAPMSFLIEQAGGKATNGVQRILDIEPERIHQRTPIYIGSPDEIDKLHSYLA